MMHDIIYNIVLTLAPYDGRKSVFIKLIPVGLQVYHP